MSTNLVCARNDLISQEPLLRIGLLGSGPSSPDTRDHRHSPLSWLIGSTFAASAPGLCKEHTMLAKWQASEVTTYYIHRSWMVCSARMVGWLAVNSAADSMSTRRAQQNALMQLKRIARE
jgi:hypothetical protein